MWHHKKAKKNSQDYGKKGAYLFLTAPKNDILFNRNFAITEASIAKIEKDLLASGK